MFFEAKEISICSLALRTEAKRTPDGQLIGRQLELSEIEDGVNANKKMMIFVVDGMFTDGELDFSTTEKALILKFMERPWGVDDAEVYLSAKKKLS